MEIIINLCLGESVISRAQLALLSRGGGGGGGKIVQTIVLFSGVEVEKTADFAQCSLMQINLLISYMACSCVL